MWKNEAFAAFFLDPFAAAVEKALFAFSSEKVISRVWRKDWTVWKPVDEEIGNRLNWLEAPWSMAGQVAGLKAWADSLRRAGFRTAVVLGMGGSSLAPEVFSSIFPTERGWLDLAVLDTTAPDAIHRARSRLQPATTVFLVSSKSGTTAETNALLNSFYDWMAERLGAANAGRHFIAVSDPASPLETLSRTLGFHSFVAGDPAIGGRFSALSAFGLAPAALKGLDLDRLLAGAADMGRVCGLTNVHENPAAVLGAILGVLALGGRNKLTLLLSPAWRSLGAWLEQLIAESTGKEGRGILPICEAGLASPDLLSHDRLFVLISSPGDETDLAVRSALVSSKVPHILLPLRERYALGRQFFLWEMATALAGRVLGINPFDQPNVDATKRRTREVLTMASAAETGDIEDIAADGPEEVVEAELLSFLGGAGPGAYAALQAFVDPDDRVERELERLRVAFRDAFRLAVTAGFGPRFLHSTGQLHKGDRGQGLFLQLVAEPARDLDIPDIPGSPAPAPSFGRLIDAQAKGDWLALRDAGRRVIRINLGQEGASGLRRLTGLIQSMRRR
ncbi:MAG: glucose-6-phosphate isomerase [Candidatus Aminicenantes bacterium]|nr:glucose-6-phosphate isomerase [Candidatus Aminicenantes bacterium]